MNKTVIDTKLIENAVSKLCLEANTIYPKELYGIVLKKYRTDKSNKYGLILKNIQIAAQTKRPLCQDTGQVLIFVKTGADVVFEGKFITDAINDGVKNAYKKCFLRKSTVKNAVFDRENTGDNTPAIIYYEYFQGSGVEINLLIKGAGAENYSALKMLRPTDTKEDIIRFIKETVKKAGEKACPPLVLGIGIGGTTDSASLLSKKAFFEKMTPEEKDFSKEIVQKMSSLELLDVRVKTASTHIASLPVSLTLNCHCTRHACALIDKNGISIKREQIEFEKPEETAGGIPVNALDIQTLKSLKPGDEILLSGVIYTARDAAHKKIEQMIAEGKELPFPLKDSILFYAGPCPAAPGEIIGPVGPTTAVRMDKFTKMMYSRGIAGAIGKGERSAETSETIQKFNGKYFCTIGGIAALMAKTVKKCEIAAFEELGTEAVYKLTVENMPLKTVI